MQSYQRLHPFYYGFILSVSGNSGYIKTKNILLIKDVLCFYLISFYFQDWA